MKKYKSFEELLENIEKKDSYWTKRLILDLTVELSFLMKRRGMTKKDFAEKLGTSQAYVTKIFKGDANFTAETIVKFARALNGEVNIHITPNEEKGSKTWFRALENTQLSKNVILHRRWSNNLNVETVTPETGKIEASIG